MTTNYIPVNAQAPGGKGSALSNGIGSLRQGRDTLRNLKAQMETMIDGGSYAEVETLFGLTTGDGEAAYNLVAGALADMEDSDALGQLLSRVA